MALRGVYSPHPRYPFAPQTAGEHLRRKRLDEGVSLVDLSSVLHIDRSTLIKWEARDEEPPASYWPRIVAWLGYDPQPEPADTAALLSWLRRRNGEEVPACAERIGVGASTLRRWEAGSEPENWRTRRLLRTFLDYERARLGLAPDFGTS